MLRCFCEALAVNLRWVCSTKNMFLLQLSVYVSPLVGNEKICQNCLLGIFYQTKTQWKKKGLLA